MSKKSIAWVVIAIVVIGGVLLFSRDSKQVSGEPIKIGAILPLTGTVAIQGEFARNGIELAREDLAKEGIDLEVVYEDGQAEPKIAIGAFNKLVQIDGVRSLVSFSSPVGMAIAPLANQNKVVTIALLAAPAFSSPDDYTFRMIGSSVLEAAALSDIIKKSGYKKIGLLYMNNDYGLGIEKTLQEIYASSDVKIVSDEGFSPTDTDYRSQLTKIKNTNPDVVIVAAFGKETGRGVKEARELGITVPLLCSAPCENPDTLQIAGAAAEGLVAVSPTNFGMNDVSKRYEEKYNMIPNYTALRMYDSTRILAYVYGECGKEVTSECLLSEMGKIKDFPGSSYKINFDQNGDINDQYVVKVVKDGKFIPVE